MTRTAAHSPTRGKAWFSLSRPVVCMAALLVASLLSRVLMVLLGIAVCSLMLNHPNFPLLNLILGLALISLISVPFLIVPYCIDVFSLYALLGRLRGNFPKRCTVVVLTMFLRLAGVFLLLFCLCKVSDPSYGFLLALILSVDLLPYVLLDTLIWMSLGLFVSWRLSRRDAQQAEAPL